MLQIARPSQTKNPSTFKLKTSIKTTFMATVGVTKPPQLKTSPNEKVSKETTEEDVPDYSEYGTDQLTESTAPSMSTIAISAPTSTYTETSTVISSTPESISTLTGSPLASSNMPLDATSSTPPVTESMPTSTSTSTNISTPTITNTTGIPTKTPFDLATTSFSSISSSPLVTSGGMLTNTSTPTNISSLNITSTDSSASTSNTYGATSAPTIAET